jgi:hypothetical protein
MFIGRASPVSDDRSEERNTSRFLALRTIPLLQTGPEGWCLSSYEHVTPTG